MQLGRKLTASAGVLALAAGMTVVSPAFAADKGDPGPEPQATEIAMNGNGSKIAWVNNTDYIDENGTVTSEGAGWQVEVEDAVRASEGWLKPGNGSIIDCKTTGAVCSNGQKVALPAGGGVFDPITFDFWVNEDPKEVGQKLTVEIATSAKWFSTLALQARVTDPNKPNETWDADHNWTGAEVWKGTMNPFDESLPLGGTPVAVGRTGSLLGIIGQSYENAIKVGTVEVPQMKGRLQLSLRGVPGMASGLELDYIKIRTNAKDANPDLIEQNGPVLGGPNMLRAEIKRMEEWLTPGGFPRTEIDDGQASDERMSEAVTDAAYELRPAIDTANQLLALYMEGQANPMAEVDVPKNEQGWIDAVNALRDAQQRGLIAAKTPAAERDTPEYQAILDDFVGRERLNDAIQNALNYQINAGDEYTRDRVGLAVDAAKAVRDGKDVTQGDRDAAAATLDGAVEAFKSLLAGETPGWDQAYADLMDTIGRIGLTDEERAGKSPADIKVAADKIAAAVAAAQAAAVQDPSGRPANIGDLVAAKAAVVAVRDGAAADLAKKANVAEDKATDEQKAALDDAATAAEIVVDDAKKAGVDPEITKALEDTITKAKEVAANPDATVKDVQEAQAALDNAKKAAEDAINKAVNVDKSGLDAQIKDSEALRDARVATEPPVLTDDKGNVLPQNEQDKYAAAYKQAQETLKDEIDAAVAAAKSVFEDPDATQGEVTAATEALAAATNGALADFQKRIEQTPVDPAADVDTSALNKAITDATAAVDDIANQEWKDKIQAAIDTAKGLLNEDGTAKAGVTQGQIDAAKGALDGLVNGAKQDQEKENAKATDSQKEALNKTIEEAVNTVAEAEKIGVDHAALDEALANAQAVAEKAANGEATANEVVAAQKALDAAKKAVDEQVNAKKEAQKEAQKASDEAAAKAAEDAKKAQEAADAAQKAAEDAQKAAEEAQAKADAEQDAAKKAEEQKKADEAKAAAEKAAKDAEAAAKAAEAAKQAAEDAAAAAEAQRKADEAKDAEAAAKAAEAAKQAAEDAQKAKEAAEQAAKDAEASKGEAESKVDATDAEKAEAKQAADEAQKAADAAKKAAEDAAKAAAEVAKTGDAEATKRADDAAKAAKEAADAAQAAADAAKAAADKEDATKKDVADAKKAAEEAKAQAEEAQKQADAAQDEIDAKTPATDDEKQAAKDAAEQAQKDADAAKQAAEDAQKAADEAQAKADAEQDAAKKAEEQKKADEAQKAADAAKKAAEDAQKAADAAKAAAEKDDPSKKDVEDAQKAAEDAKAAAEAAKKAAEDAKQVDPAVDPTDGKDKDGNPTEVIGDVTFKRYAGELRTQTADKANKDHPVKGGAAFIATGWDFPDALSAAPAVVKTEGALYLSHPVDGLSPETIKLIQDQDPEAVYVLGGTSIVPGNVTTQLKFLTKKGVVIDRIAGADRYVTSMQIAQKFFPGAKAGYLATGQNFADALAVGSLAGKNQAPVLLVNGKDGLSGEQENLFGDNAKVTIVGGVGVVDKSFDTSIASNGWERERLFGDNRYETAAKILEKYDAKANSVWMVTGENFPDALAAASIAGREGDPVVLTQDKAMKANVATQLARFTDAKFRYVMGGETIVSTPIAKSGLEAKEPAGQ